MSISILLAVVFGLIAVSAIYYLKKVNAEVVRLRSEIVNLNIALESKKVEAVALAQNVDDRQRTISQLQMRSDDAMTRLAEVREENARLKSSLQHFNEEQKYREEQMGIQFKNLQMRFLSKIHSNSKLRMKNG